MFLTLLALQVLAPPAHPDAFAFLEPSVTITAAERTQLDHSQPIARVLPAKDQEVAVVAAVPVNIDGDRLVAWMRQIDALKKSAYVLAIGRFSASPRIEDLADLSLDDADLSEIRRCRPASCGLKLSAAEIVQLQSGATRACADWKSSVQQAFRRIVLDRVKQYLASGEVAAYDDQQSEVLPAARFASLLDHSPYLVGRVPRFAEYLRRYPPAATADVESFVYWSKERLARKAVVTVTQVNIIRSRESDLPAVLVAGKQIFSTHYFNASLGLTALMRGQPGGSNYLLYINRSELDMLHGTFAGALRWFLQRRLKGEAGDALRELRRRLESGQPPPLSLIAEGGL
jgi:hypothetical protein